MEEHRLMKRVRGGLEEEKTRKILCSYRRRYEKRTGGRGGKKENVKG